MIHNKSTLVAPLEAWTLQYMKGENAAPKKLTRCGNICCQCEIPLRNLVQERCRRKQVGPLQPWRVVERASCWRARTCNVELAELTLSHAHTPTHALWLLYLALPILHQRLCPSCSTCLFSLLRWPADRWSLEHRAERKQEIWCWAWVWSWTGSETVKEVIFLNFFQRTNV